MTVSRVYQSTSGQILSTSIFKPLRIADILVAAES